MTYLMSVLLLDLLTAANSTLLTDPETKAQVTLVHTERPDGSEDCDASKDGGREDAEEKRSLPQGCSTTVGPEMTAVGDAQALQVFT